ncbi:MAG TPA: DUF1648 domain-containing protein [Microbacterium sp.]|nr:DUF1648 domain-containing protein [Microbacterium sp.]
MTEQLLTTRKKARRAFAVLCLWIPLAVFAAISIAQLALMPVLPETVAIHWGGSGVADGFGPAWTYPAMTFGIGGGLTVLIAGLALFEVKGEAQRTQYRFLGAVIGAETGLLGTMMLGLVIVQVGLADATDAPNSYWILGLGLIVAAAMGIVYFLVLEEPPAADADERDVAPLELGDLEQAVWIRSARMSRTAGWTLGLLLGLTTLGMLVICFIEMRGPSGASWAVWGTLALMLVVTFLSLAMVRFDVRVDADGLSARPPIGWPRIHVPASRITSARVVEVSPMAEFGGWGWRIGASGTGIVLRAGEGIRIGREGKSDLTITVDDAETAVALLRRTMERAA